MKTRVWVYLVVAVLSVGVGVAIAGAPNSVPRASTIAAPATTSAPAPPPPEGSAATTSEASTTTSPDEPDTTSTTTEPATPPEPTTSVSSTSTTVGPAALPNRADVDVSVVNGARIDGVATRAATALEALGYVDVAPFDGSDVLEVSVVYAAQGSQEVAARLADEAGLAPGLVRPIDEIPPIDEVVGADVVVYLGRDVGDLSLLG